MTAHPKVLAEIDTAALINNYKLMEKLTGSSQICVVKADCYGHGIECAGVFYDCGCRSFAVSGTDEALLLREYFNEGQRCADILIFGYVNPGDIPELIDADITIAVFSDEYALLLAEKIPAGKRLRIHVKINSGMNRIGYAKNECPDALKLYRDERFKCEGIFTHFACADEPEREPTLTQAARFDNALEYLRENGADLGVVHASNSAASVGYSLKYDSVRSGIVLYGLNPSDDCRIEGLKPVMTLKTRIAQVHTLPAGESVSYGWEFTSNHDMTVATVPIGYADGFIRAYKNGYMIVHGQRAKILGRICMDQCMIDVTDIPDVHCTDEVTVFGGDGMTADELAKMAGTINYEVTCLISKRVGRTLV